MIPLILFLGLTVATAVIAYWSDNLGKKLGKKRVSLLGMRPRTTATFLTIGSSWLIMGVTLAALLLTVRPLRRALFRYESVSQNLKIAEKNLDVTEQQLEETQDLSIKTRNQLGNAQNALQRAKNDVVIARKDAKEAEDEGKKRVLGAQRLVALAQKRAADAQKRANGAQNRFRVAQSRFNAAQQRLVEAQQRVIEAQQRFQEAQRGEDEARKLAQDARSDLSGTRLRLAKARTELTNAQVKGNQAKAEFERAATAYEDLAKQSLQVEREKNRLESEKNRLQEDVNVLNEQAVRFYNAAKQLSRGDVSIRYGQGFAAGIIEAGKSQARIEENLRQLLAKGQQSMPPGLNLRLALASEVVDGQPVILSENEIFSRLAKAIASNEEATSVRLVAAGNFTSDETEIEAGFVAVPVATAFHAGDVLATTQIDSKVGDALIFRALGRLADAGSEEAAKRGVNPPLTPDEPNFYAAGTNVAIFATLRRLEAAKGVRRVNVVAADDLSTVEPLRVRFEIEGLPNP